MNVENFARMENLTQNALSPRMQAVVRVLITAIDEKMTKTGNPYVTFTVTDGTNTQSINSFHPQMIREKLIEAGYLNAVADILLRCDPKGYTNIDYLWPVPDADYSQYIPTPSIPFETMFNEVMGKLNNMVNAGAEIARVAEQLLQQNKDKLRYWSAAMKMHHNIYGGLFFHLYSVSKEAMQIVRGYQMAEPSSADAEGMIQTTLGEVDCPTLFVGALLHDIGKLRELETSPVGAATYTVDGTLFGHALLGISMVEETINSLEDAEEFRQRNEKQIKNLLHIIASHHGKPEMGAIVTPATTEAYIVHQTDMLDSRLYVYGQETRTLESGGISDRVYMLDKAQVVNLH